MASWNQLGDLATVAQLTGLDAAKLISLIVRAAAAARMHKRNCRQFAEHLRLIGGLLDTLRLSELKRYPDTREPLEGLEDALRRAYVLVDSCRDRSYLYLLAMGWNIVYNFRRAQNEIDRYLRLVPLITLVDNNRVRERLEHIEKDQCEYTLDEEDRKMQDALFNHGHSNDAAIVLKKTLSCSYPDIPFDQALQKESQKLQMELQRSQSNMDIGQCEVIQHLLGVTETVANSLPEKSCSDKGLPYSKSESVKKEASQGDIYPTKQENLYVEPSKSSPVPCEYNMPSSRGTQWHDEWNTDLLGCCSEPYLCMKTFFCPCGTFAKISSVAKNRPISSAEACNDLLAYSLILSCCCYTCCVRRKLRQKLNIKGGFCDDFLSHLLCCCCALVQEWREVEMRGNYSYGDEKTEVCPPKTQYMDP